MNEEREISSDLHLREVNDEELSSILEQAFGGALYDDSNDEEFVFYPDKSRARVKLKYKGGYLLSALAGAALSDEMLRLLQARVESELLGPCQTIVASEILLSEKLVSGSFRYRDLFQILPAPEGAPKPPPNLPGMYPRHPFLLEFSFPGSSNAIISGFRKIRVRAELESMLSVLLDGTVEGTGAYGRYRWVRSDIGGCNFAQEGYLFSGLPSESSTFSDSSYVSKIPEVDPTNYYDLTWSASMPLKVPSDLSPRLNAFYNLRREEKETWLRAAHWLRQSSVSLWTSHSAAYLALITAVESLMPAEDRGNGRKFQEFVVRFAPGQGLAADRTRFYGIRSKLIHGKRLSYYDQSPLGISITPHGLEEQRRFESMRRVAKLAVANWLLRS
jgi:hypothetical protein